MSVRVTPTGQRDSGDRMPKLGRVVAALGLALLLSVLVFGGRSQAQSAPIVLRDLAYYSGPDFVAGSHTLDLFIPASRQFPLIHFVHGGGWTMGDKQEVPGERYDNVAWSLVSEGFAVSLVNYRLSDGPPDGVMHPEHARDVTRAIAFANSVLIARGRRASGRFVMGHDAGAHLAALVATNPRFLGEQGMVTADINGVIGLSGIYSIPPLSDTWSEVFGLDPETRLDASPRRFVDQSAADFLLLRATDDLPGRAEEAQAFAAALTGAGRSAVSVPIAGRDHLGIIRRFGEAGDPAADRVADFVRAVLPVPTEPTSTPIAELSPTPGPTDTPSETATPTATSSAHTPPGQRIRGPGGSERAHPETHTERGAGWIAVLPDPPPTGPLKLIVFVPDRDVFDEPGSLSSSSWELEPYAGWWEHLARGGFAVIVPEEPVDGSELGVDEVRSATGDAIISLSRRAELDTDGVIWAGHGLGATTATLLAADWFERRLPPPRALMAVDPRRHGEALPWLGPPHIPNDVPVVFISLEDAPRLDPFIEPALWSAAGRVSGRRKTRIELRTDRFGQPWLVADASAPFTEAPGRSDALDWYGTWRVLDALAACATASTWCEELFGDPDIVQDMGRWSDGTPVQLALVSDGPPLAPWIRLLLPSVGTGVDR